MVNLKERSIEELMHLDFECSCGRRHRLNIGDIKIGPDILEMIPRIMEEFKGKEVLLVADKNTYKVAGQKVADILSKVVTLHTFIYGDKGDVIADARSLGELLLELGMGPSHIVAVGSGTLNDIVKYVSAKTGIPYTIVSTAPSMDGYASTVAALIWKGVKSTFNGVYPAFIVGDTKIMKDAPMHMLQAGLGDVLGKYTGLADWRMSKIFDLERGEPYCDNVAGLMESAVEKCVAVAPKLTGRAEDTIQAIMEGLVLSGLCIGFVGHSRPASGSEHQVSHYFEMKFLQDGIDTKWLHGNMVGVGTVAVIEAYDYLFSMDIEDIKSSCKYMIFDKDEWTSRIIRCFGDMSRQIFDLKEQSLLTEKVERQERMDLIAEKWKEIKKNCYLTIPSSDEIISILKETGAIYSPLDLGVDRQLFKDSLMVSKEIRNRYGIMQLLDDLGMLEEAAEHITNKYYNA